MLIVTVFRELIPQVEHEGYISKFLFKFFHHLIDSCITCVYGGTPGLLLFTLNYRLRKKNEFRTTDIILQTFKSWFKCC